MHYDMVEDAAMALLLVIISIVATRNARKLEWRERPTGRIHSRDRLHVLRKLDELPEKEFKRIFRVERATFDVILKKISHRIERRMPSRAHARGPALPPVLMLACALRFLAGGLHCDICFKWEISRCVSARAARAPRGRDYERLHLSALGTLFGSPEPSRDDVRAFLAPPTPCARSRCAGPACTARSTMSWMRSMPSSRSTFTLET